MEKIKVEFKETPRQSNFKKNDIGYIVDFMHGADNRPYAVVVGCTNIDLVMMSYLKPI